MKREGRIIYASPLGKRSQELINYFEEIDGAPNITPEYNPATWMLEASSIASENLLAVDFAIIYLESSLYQRSKALRDDLKEPVPGFEDIHFKMLFSQSWVQVRACMWKQHWSYWWNPQCSAVRLHFRLCFTFASIFWKMGSKVEKLQDLLNVMGSMYAVVILLGVSNASSVQPVLDIERSVFYRERASGMLSALPYALGQGNQQGCKLRGLSSLPPG